MGDYELLKGDYLFHIPNKILYRIMNVKNDNSRQSYNVTIESSAGLECDIEISWFEFILIDGSMFHSTYYHMRKGLPPIGTIIFDYTSEKLDTVLAAYYTSSTGDVIESHGGKTLYGNKNDYFVVLNVHQIPKDTKEYDGMECPKCKSRNTGIGPGLVFECHNCPNRW